MLQQRELRDGWFRQHSDLFGVLASQEREDTTMTTESITSVPATDGQTKHARRLIEDAAEGALRELALDKGAMQRLIEQGSDPIKSQLVTLLRGLALTDEYANEEAPSSYGYLSGYAPKSVANQMATLAGLFPGLKSFVANAATKALPSGAEGMFLIPRWQEIASTYGEAVAIVLGKLALTRGGKFYNYRDGQLGSDRLRQTAKKVAAFQRLGDEQKGHHVLVVPAQFGLRHRGKSVRRARVVMGGNEFGLGAFEVGIMLLTHPDRLANYDDLWVDCGGDEYAPDVGGVFSYAPYFHFYDENLGFYTDDVGVPNDDCGSASAFSLVVPTE